MRAILLLLGLVMLVPPADGCGIPWRHGQLVSVASEDALIVWDAGAKTEHFIRRANFRTEAKDFGFLVPTPTMPVLEEADETIFATLAHATAPKIIYQHRTEKVYRLTNPMHYGASPPPAAAVEILDRKKVAGYDAVVLKANDPTALRDWLDKNGYEARPELVEWFRWYTDHNWIMTAFKLSKDGSAANQLTGRTVRLTFQTEVPFYPYREPTDMRKDAGAGQRLLRVYFLSDKRYEGTLGKEGSWSGRAVWSNLAPDDTARAVISGLGLEPKARDVSLAKKWHLTEFEDSSFPRPGTDEVYFRVAANQDAVEKPPVIVPIVDYEYVDVPADYTMPALLGVVGLIGIGVVGWRLVRK
ncbi:DUF2330 domain-containing protein [Limnoglobus roseus]|uniref:DUF2330 domain-containing protein n=1 Tax=Limnoglobus roseus TaxID=2598579 RepID=A0A5C1A7N2_9BACT|nr:DUF2330 domain-containing protein [Limnoglobus roseus]QEL14233.1 hypothetical protein PX52LOC_01103 [Limnoglobus roseus]